MIFYDICSRNLSIRTLTSRYSTFVSSLNPCLLVSECQTRKRELGSLLQLCILNKLFIHIDSIHAQFIVSGLQSNIFANNLLLNGHSKSGNVRKLRHLFDRMPERNLISWSSIISAYTQNGYGQEALNLFSEFQRSSYENPNEFIFASIMRACVQSQADDQAKQLHGFVIKTGFELDLYVGTSLVDFYSKIGRIEDARIIFDELPIRTPITWTAIITGYSQNGQSETSLHLFNQMRETHVQLDRFVLSSVISACSILGFLKGGKQIHCYALRHSIEVDVSINNILIDFYSKCSQVFLSRRVFDSMIVKNVISWTTIIAGYMQNAHHKSAMDVFRKMTQEGWKPDGFTCTSILSSCGSQLALKHGKEIHCYSIKCNLDGDDFVKNGIVDMYAKCNSLVNSRKSFDIMVTHNLVSYNAMIEAYASHNELFEAVSIFGKMRLDLLKPSVLTFVSLLGVSASLSNLDLSKQVHCLIIKEGVSLDTFIGSALIDVYSKCLCINDAKTLFDLMSERDIVVWNAMISGFSQSDQCEMAIKLFINLHLYGMKPNEFTFVSIITSASNLASLVHGLQFHTQIVKLSLDSDPYVSNTLLDMYAKCGSITEARQLFDTMIYRDVACWNSMISKYAQHGLAEDALSLFDKMQIEYVQPNYVTFVGVLSACSHVGLVERGLVHFESMKTNFGIEPGNEHFACVVALLGRAGKLEDAIDFIGQMPIEPTAIVWRSLLSACRILGNVDLGKFAAEKAISMNSKDSGTYVLLSNIFASKGMWSEVEMVRKVMDSNEVVKEPGHSWIEVNGVVHVFISRDNVHEDIEAIYSMLDGLKKDIIRFGYVPDISMKLEDD